MSREPYVFYQIDAFASSAFEGNQACVMPLADWSLPDDTLQKIAAENNVAETAFLVRTAEDTWDLRWFTPAIEVPLCGHATLASAHALFSHEGFAGETITFQTRKSGQLTVSRAGDGYEMDFPAAPIKQVDGSDSLVEALGARPKAVWAGAYVAAVFETADEIRALSPDQNKLKAIDLSEWEPGCVGCLAVGGPDGADITSRFFAPGAGLPEDPATGSWHCMVAPVGKVLLGQDTARCFQAYPGRGAWIETQLVGDRVKLRGQAVTVIEGRFFM